MMLITILVSCFAVCASGAGHEAQPVRVMRAEEDGPVYSRHRVKRPIESVVDKKGDVENSATGPKPCISPKASVTGPKPCRSPKPVRVPIATTTVTTTPVEPFQINAPEPCPQTMTTTLETFQIKPPEPCPETMTTTSEPLPFQIKQTEPCPETMTTTLEPFQIPLPCLETVTTALPEPEPVQTPRRDLDEPLAETVTTTQPCEQPLASEGAVDCVASDWSEWTACRSTCGTGGNSSRLRTVLKEARNGGAPCYDLIASRECNQGDCPNDCEWLQWSDWGCCSASCGKATRSAVRNFVPEKHGGRSCDGTANKSEACNLPACPKGCEMSDWGDWFACSTSCGIGLTTRYRQVEEAAVNTDCNETTDQNACINPECPVDCTLDVWTLWSFCSASCGGGQQMRTRAVLNKSEHGGLPCDISLQNRSCNVEECSVDCKLDQWTDWGLCSAPCGKGTRDRIRVVKQQREGSGEACDGPLNETEECLYEDCSTDCETSDWTDWSECSESCGYDGHSRRTREITSEAYKDGKPCPGGNETLQKKVCNEGPCPVHCAWGDWQDWRSCTTTCGNGSQLRLRLVDTPPERDGDACEGSSSETAECSVAHCPVHCTWNDWNDWLVCSSSCGGGKSRRTRTHSSAKYGGMSCSGQPQEDQNCSTQPCPVDCVWSDWSSWNCYGSCLPASQKRIRTVLKEVQNGGRSCEGQTTETAECTANMSLCPVDCVWGQWEEWSACSASCGSGFRLRLRNRAQHEAMGGHLCYGTQDDQELCTAGDCPLDCIIGDWSHWSDCPRSCGRAQKTRSRKVARPANYGGADCVCHTLENTTCLNDDCPIDCEYSQWTDWSACPQSCGGAVTTRVRYEKVNPAFGGKTCEGGVKEDAVCNEAHCPVDCDFSAWSDWGACTASCSGGTRISTRHLVSNALFGGAECKGSAKKSENCNGFECPVDCEWSCWSSWSTCSKPCDTGISKRNRTRLDASYGGAACSDGVSSEDKVCNTQACGRDCIWSEWTNWTACSKLCGGGSTKRFRDVLVVKKSGGAPCYGDDHEESECNPHECPINCEWNDWGAWGACFETCNGGHKTRRRTKKVKGKFGGTECEGQAEETLSCDLPPCPIDCTFSPWSDWGDCTASCGKGSRFKTRTRQEGRYGGLTCLGSLITSGDCFGSGCPETTQTTTQISVSNLTEILDAFLKPHESTGERKADTLIRKLEKHARPPPKPCKKVVTKLLPKITSPFATGPPEYETVKEEEEVTVEEGPCTTDEIAADIERYQASIASKAAEPAKPCLRHRQGKEVTATVSGDLVLFAENPAAMSTSGTVKVNLEWMIAKLAGVDAGAVECVVQVPSEADLAAVNQKQGNTVVAYSVYLYKGEKRTPEDVSKAIAKENAASISNELKDALQGSLFSSTAISMSLRVTRA